MGKKKKNEKRGRRWDDGEGAAIEEEEERNGVQLFPNRFASESTLAAQLGLAQHFIFSNVFHFFYLKKTMFDFLSNK